jgi:hypothetical protein
MSCDGLGQMSEPGPPPAASVHDAVEGLAARKTRERWRRGVSRVQSTGAPAQQSFPRWRVADLSESAADRQGDIWHVELPRVCCTWIARCTLVDGRSNFSGLAGKRTLDHASILRGVDPPPPAGRTRIPLGVCGPTDGHSRNPVPESRSKHEDR